MSALNLVLGIGFDYSSSGYTTRHSAPEVKPFGAFHQTLPGLATPPPPPPVEPDKPSGGPLERLPEEGRLDQLVTDDDIPPSTLSHLSSSV